MLIMTVVFKNRITDGNAFVTNVSLRIVGGRGDQLPDYILAFVAEGTTQSIIRASALHWDLLTDHLNLNADILIIAKLGRKHKNYPSKMNYEDHDRGDAVPGVCPAGPQGAETGRGTAGPGGQSRLGGGGWRREATGGGAGSD